MLVTDPAERDTVAALLQLQVDLARTLRQAPVTSAERRAWSSAVSTMLIEAARGRVYLDELRQRWRSGDERLEQLAS